MTEVVNNSPKEEGNMLNLSQSVLEGESEESYWKTRALFLWYPLYGNCGVRFLVIENRSHRALEVQ